MTEREFELSGVVPWGRIATEYEQFFALNGLACDASILDCGGGPSSFAPEYGARGYTTVSLDPIFQWPAHALKEQFDATVEPMLAGMRRAHYRFVWNYYESPEQVYTLRHRALEKTLDQLSKRQRCASYVAGALPRLPFRDGVFDLALSSHLLFLYSDDLPLEFHVAATQELLRVAQEVQVFPLLNLDGSESVHLAPLLEVLDTQFECDIETIDFEFQRNGNRRLRLRRV